MKRVSLLVVLFGALLGPAGLCAVASETTEPTGNEQPKKYWCTFLDALGEPMPGVEVQIFRRNERDEKEPLKRALTDEYGGLQAPNLHRSPNECLFFVSHPNYGVAMASKAPYEGFERSAYCYVPLVPKGSEDYSRAIRGVVLDPNANPVPSAKITCHGVSAPGHVWLRAFGGAYTVISDQDGRFAMYLPIKLTLGTYDVPAHSNYKVMIEPPGDAGLALWSGGISNKQECTIVLSCANHFRTFLFKDANAPITDPEKLKRIWLPVEVPHYGTWYLYDYDFKKGRVLPLGELRATMYGVEGWPFGSREFEPVVVTDDSPQQLVFTLKTVKPKPLDKDILFRGLVVHGITGKPMPGAFVAAAGVDHNDFSVLGADQWRRLHVLPTRPSLDDPALKPVLLIRPARAVVRADKTGRFELTVNRSRRFYYIIGFEEDYLAMHYYVKAKWDPDSSPENIVEIPALKLYPAATVLVEPIVPGPAVRINAKWELLKNERLPWFEDFANEYGPAARYMENLYLRPNKVGSIHIPAGVDLGIHLKIVPNSPWDDRKWLPVTTKTTRAKQGETINLDRVTFEQAMPIYVQLLDSAGKLLVGVGVMHAKDTAGYHRHYDQLCVTDEDGIAEFQVPPYHKGVVYVGCHAPNKGYITESVRCHTNGPEDANTVYALQVSDEIIYHLFKQGKEQ